MATELARRKMREAKNRNLDEHLVRIVASQSTHPPLTGARLSPPCSLVGRLYRIESRRLRYGVHWHFAEFSS